MPDLFIAKNAKDQSKKEEIKKTITPPAFIPPGGQPLSLFTTFARNPTGLSFEDQDPGETVLLFLRRDFITNVPWIAIFILLLLLPTIIFGLSSFFFLDIPSLPGNLAFVLISFYFLIVVGYGFFNYISWYYNVGIVTQKRIVDIDFINLTSKNISLSYVSAIKDVEYTQNGFLSTFFDYGNVRIQIETINSHIEFLLIPRPAEVANFILELRGTQQ